MDSEKHVGRYGPLSLIPLIISRNQTCPHLRAHKLSHKSYWDRISNGNELTNSPTSHNAAFLALLFWDKRFPSCPSSLISSSIGIQEKWKQLQRSHKVANPTSVFPIFQLFVPGCTGLTPEGVIRAVENLTKHNQNLISLKINGIYGINKQHLETLHSLLRTNQRPQQQQEKQAIFYHNHNNKPLSKNEENGRPIDIDVCPKCDQPRLVFDCSRENCECRGCSYCVLRCAECGKCVAYEEQGDAACEDTLCLDCWIGLQKCDFCNRPYCNRHADRRCSLFGSSVCDACYVKFSSD